MVCSVYCYELDHVGSLFARCIIIVKCLVRKRMGKSLEITGITSKNIGMISYDFHCSKCWSLVKKKSITNHPGSSSGICPWQVEQVGMGWKLDLLGWLFHYRIGSISLVYLPIFEGSLNRNFRQYGELKSSSRVIKSVDRRCNSQKVRRKKISPRQMLEKSRNAVFFHRFVCRVSPKVGLLKRRVRR